MFSTLPGSAKIFMDWSWEQVKPFADDLTKRPLTAANVDAWLKDWSDLDRLLAEMYHRKYLATTINTEDAEAKQRFNAFLDDVYPHAEELDQACKEMLLASGLEPQGMAIPLHNMRAEAALFRQANLPLRSEELKLSTQYDELAGKQTVIWEGKELTVAQLQPIYQEPERQKRERAWRMAMERQLADRQALNELWARFLDLRGQMAANADKPDYRAYRWQQLLRFDYTPEDSKSFQQAIEEVVVPAARRIYERRRQQLGLATLRPWDLDVDPLGRPPLRPFSQAAELEEKTSAIFHSVDPKLGGYFDLMRRQNLLDIENRKGKAPGAFCIMYPIPHLPFVFENAVGLHEDVQTLLHESGHAFHVFETSFLPYYHQVHTGMEFAEVASMAMELLAAPYLAVEHGGFYSEKEAARARVEHLETLIRFWPYMAVVDAFQHWVYENAAAAGVPANCDAKWTELWRRFMVGVDWSGLDDIMMTGWQRKLHIFQEPFYYVEYGLAQLGAVQVWRNALSDQAGAVAAYRRALALGCTVTLPELYAAAGAKFAFDAGTLREAVTLIEMQIERLEAV